MMAVLIACSGGQSADFQSFQVAGPFDIIPSTELINTQTRVPIILVLASPDHNFSVY